MYFLNFHTTIAMRRLDRLKSFLYYLGFALGIGTIIEFSEIPNLSRQAKQADKITHIILYFCMKIQKYVFLILH